MLVIHILFRLLNRRIFQAIQFDSQNIFWHFLLHTSDWRNALFFSYKQKHLQICLQISRINIYPEIIFNLLSLFTKRSLKVEIKKRRRIFNFRNFAAYDRLISFFYVQFVVRVFYVVTYLVFVIVPICFVYGCRQQDRSEVCRLLWNLVATIQLYYLGFEDWKALSQVRAIKMTKVFRLE